MLKFLNLTVLMLFVLFASAAPYISAKGTATAFTQTPEERAAKNTVIDEEIHHTSAHSFFIHYHELDYSISFLEVLSPQKIQQDVLKPPSRTLS